LFGSGQASSRLETQPYGEQALDDEVVRSHDPVTILRHDQSFRAVVSTCDLREKSRSSKVIKGAGTVK
jgi:hypothetical protein